MKRIIFSSILFVSILTNGYSQTISEIILDMPDSVIYGMSTDLKEDLISNPTDSIFEIKDHDLYASIKRLSFSEDYMKISTSEVGEIQIKLLPLINDTKIICVVKTVCKGICDSHLSFYSLKWTPIDNDGLYPKPELKWFLKEDVDKDSETFKNAIALVDILPVKLILSKDSESLIAELNIEKYMDEKSYKDLKPFLNDNPKILTWNKTSFKYKGVKTKSANG